jgi:hypothetical protein
MPDLVVAWTLGESSTKAASEEPVDRAWVSKAMTVTDQSLLKQV